MASAEDFVTAEESATRENIATAEEISTGEDVATGEDDATTKDIAISVESGSTVFFDNICQPCEYDGHIFEAEGRCEDCDENLCKPCFLAHTVPFKMRLHVMTVKYKLNTDGTRERKDRCTKKCSQHDDEFIKFYCPTHSFLGCSACMIMNHKACSGTVYIPEVAKDLLSSEEYNNYNASKSAIETTSQEIRTDAKERIETINTCQTAAVEKFRRFKKEIIDLLDTEEKTFIEESENIKEEELKKQESILDKTVAVEKEIRDLTSPVEKIEALKQYCNMYILLMKTTDGLKSCEKALRVMNQRKDPHREIRFLPNHNVVAELQSCRRIGKIKDGIIQVKHERDVNVKTKSDTKTCWISSSVMLPANKLILTDCENNKLKMIDTRKDKVVEELSISSTPWDVTATSFNEVAVTLYEKKIAFVKTDDKLVNHRIIDVDGKCRGVAYRENTLVVSYKEPPKIEVMDMKGAVLRTLATDDQMEANLNLPLCVVFNSIDDAIYISDAKCSKVVCLSSDGTLKSTYTDTDLATPTGMTVDSFGNVYVCDNKNHTLHQITKNCRKKGTILTEKDVVQPYTISYCEAKEKFYIGMRNNDIMKVFKVI